MKSLSESPAILTVHAGPAGQYILRVGDLRYRPLIVGVTRLLPDASSLVVITPSDIKVYAVAGNGVGPSVAEDHATEEDADPELEAAIAQEEGRAIPGDLSDSSTPAPTPTSTEAAEVVGETPQGTKVVRRRKSPTPIAGHEESCQRCAGAGRIKILLDGGAASEAGCPICRGTGILRRYGSKR